jgi:hypothetical protein
MHYYFDRETTMRLLKRVIFPFRIAVAFGILAYPSGMALAQPAQDAQAPTPRERELLDRIRALEERLSAVEARLAASPTAISTSLSGA